MYDYKIVLLTHKYEDLNRFVTVENTDTLECHRQCDTFDEAVEQAKALTVNIRNYVAKEYDWIEIVSIRRSINPVK